MVSDPHMRRLDVQPTVQIGILFAGSARTRRPFDLTMNTNDAIEAAHAFRDATIVPIHCEGWAHFTQSGKDLKDSFQALGIASGRSLERPQRG